MYDTEGQNNNIIITNGTNTIKPLEEVTFIITLCVLCPIVFVVVFGNLLVIISIFVDRSLRKPQNMYFVSLAVVDLLVGVFVLPFSVLHALNPVWTFGKVMCKFYLTLDTTLSMMSFFHLVAIALDRYRSINDGIQYIQKITYRSVFIALAGVFIVSLWISLPPVLGWGWDKDDWWDDSTKCDILRSPGYVVYSAFGSLLFPMALMVYMYIQIYFTLSRKIREKARIKSLAHGHTRPVSYPEAIANRQSAFVDIEIIAEEITGTLSKKSQSQSSLRLPRNLSVKRIKSLALHGRPVSNPNPCTGTGRQSAIVEVDVEMNTGETDTIKPLKKSESSAILPTSLSAKRMLRSEINERFSRENKKLKDVNMSQEVLDFVALKQKFSLSQQRNAARTLGMIISGFLICWLPFCVVYVTSPFLPDDFTPPDAVFIVVAWLAYLNSGLNPIIYTVFHKEFRNAFKKILCIT